MIAWGEMMRLAALRFTIPPAAFWALSLREWRALAGQAAPVLTRGGLEALLRAYPDEETK